MNIVLINHYAGDGKNGMEYRPYLMARRWVAAGESVTIVASSFSHLRSKNPDLAGAPYKEEYIDGIRYLWIRGNSYEGNGVGRIRNMLSFLRGLYRYGKVIVPDTCDAVIASSTYPLDIYPARKLARKHSAKFVFELHDMWPLSPIELGGMSPKHPYIRVMQKAENDWCRTADEVVSLLPAAKDYLVEHGMAPEKFHYIPNGVDKEAWDDTVPIPEEHEQAIAKLREDPDTFIVGYTGGHGLSNALDLLIDAAGELEDSRVRIVMVGNGPEKERLGGRVRNLNLANRVVMLPPVPKDCVPNLLNHFDAVFVSMLSQPLYRFGVALNKMMDYMMAGKPIVSVIDAANDYVKDAGCGLSIPTGGSRDVALAFSMLANLSFDERVAMGASGRRYVLSSNDSDVLAERFLQVLKS